jgi:adenylate kinase
MARTNPNILVTGTPGVGKTTHAEEIARNLGFTHLAVNQIVKDEGFHEGRDEEMGSWIVDEDKVRHVASPNHPKKKETKKGQNRNGDGDS